MLINSLKCLTVKKDKIIKIVEYIWIITHNSQCIIPLSVSIIKVKCKKRQKTEQIKR